MNKIKEYDLELYNCIEKELNRERNTLELIASENYEEYMHNLVDAFNPVAAENVMCTNTLSVSWEGYLYDCDFNQMLALKVDSEQQHIRDFNLKSLEKRTIHLSQHCYGCTAGAGSSCQGSIA